MAKLSFFLITVVTLISCVQASQPEPKQPGDPGTATVVSCTGHIRVDYNLDCNPSQMEFSRNSPRGSSTVEAKIRWLNSHLHFFMNGPEGEGPYWGSKCEVMVSLFDSASRASSPRWTPDDTERWEVTVHALSRESARLDVHLAVRVQYPPGTSIATYNWVITEKAGKNIVTSGPAC